MEENGGHGVSCHCPPHNSPAPPCRGGVQACAWSHSALYVGARDLNSRVHMLVLLPVIHTVFPALRRGRKTSSSGLPALLPAAVPTEYITENEKGLRVLLRLRCFLA